MMPWLNASKVVESESTSVPSRSKRIPLSMSILLGYCADPMLLSHVPPYFKARRDALMKSKKGTAFIFPSAHELLRNPDVNFPFRQESNFYYLSGFDEPESFLVLVPEGSQPSKSGGYRMVLFVRR